MKPLYQRAKFLKSITHIRQAPFSNIEVAFAGRSNCGKSSLINVLTQQKKIARVSKTPGRTREINFFELDDQKFLVDLPGYGYAKVSREIQKKWRNLLESYLLKRESLGMVFILMDSRHLLTKLDKILIDFCFNQNIAISILATKGDQVNQSERDKIKKTIQEFIFSQYQIDFAAIWITSSLKKTGFEPVFEQLDRVLEVNLQVS